MGLDSMKGSKLRLGLGLHMAALMMAGGVLLHAPTAEAKFIAVSVSAEDNFRNILSSHIEAAVDARNDQVYIDSAEDDFDLQLQQVKNYIAAGADAIIIFATGTTEKNRQLFEFAKQVPLVFINTEPVEDMSTMPANTVYVGSNELESGTLEMEELARQANYKGNVALLQGDPTHKAAVLRTKDVEDVVAKYPNMKIVVKETGHWARNEAYKLVSDWLKKGTSFDILAANNDEMAIGSIMAMRDSGKDPKKFLVGGVDATRDALLEMSKGDLAVTVLQDAENQGKDAVDIAYKLINRQKVKNPHWVPFRLVTKENYRQLIKE